MDIVDGIHGWRMQHQPETSVGDVVMSNLVGRDPIAVVHGEAVCVFGADNERMRFTVGETACRR